MEISEWKKAIDINLNGTFYVIRSLVNHMLDNGKGNIIIIGSATVETGSGGGLHYAAAKTALFLASDDSGYICGADIVADGGAIHYLH